MRTSRRIATTSALLALALSLSTIPLAFGAEAEYPPGITGSEPNDPESKVVYAEPKESDEVITIKVVVPTAKNLEGLKNGDTSKPVALSDSAILGGIKSDNEGPKETVKANSKKSTELQTVAGTPTNVRVSGFRKAPTDACIHIFVSVTGKDGLTKLGCYDADKYGAVTLPVITLDADAAATFILREEIRLANGKFQLLQRVVVSVRATAVADFSTSQVVSSS